MLCLEFGSERGYERCFLQQFINTEDYVGVFEIVYKNLKGGNNVIYVCTNL